MREGDWIRLADKCLKYTKEKKSIEQHLSEQTESESFKYFFYRIED